MTDKKRAKKDLKEILSDMSDPEKVLASPDIISANELSDDTINADKKLTKQEKIKLKKYTNSIIVKGSKLCFLLYICCSFSALVLVVISNVST